MVLVLLHVQVKMNIKNKILNQIILIKAGYYINVTAKLCEPCFSSCATCFDNTAASNKCLTC